MFWVGQLTLKFEFNDFDETQSWFENEYFDETSPDVIWQDIVSGGQAGKVGIRRMFGAVLCYVHFVYVAGPGNLGISRSTDTLRLK